MNNRLARAAIALGVSAALLAGCSSDAKPPSKTALVSKLNSEPDFASLKTQADPTKYQSFLGCIADFLLEKGKTSDVADYVAGKKTLDAVKGYSSDSEAEQKGKDCATSSGLGS